jgi:hypothetical protein
MIFMGGDNVSEQGPPFKLGVGTVAVALRATMESEYAVIDLVARNATATALRA